MKDKKFLKNWVILLVFIALSLSGVKFYYDYLLSPLNPADTEEKRFIVYKGEATTKIGKRLEKEGFIRSANAFSILVRTSDMASKIQAGEFKLSPSMSAEEILRELSVGTISKWVTLVEGWRVEEMAERLNKELGVDKNQFLKVATEGYMFPDTYLFNTNATAFEIAEEMRQNFYKKYDSSLQNKIKNLGLTPEEGVILASIVEREARSDEARTMVASILLKRYKIGMGLNADATIQYALGYQPSEKSWWKRHLSKEDLKVASPYNTYLYKGLPPTAISNPSLSSLKAVANADSNTPYLYYYHDSEGKSHYAKTLEEHNENVANYP